MRRMVTLLCTLFLSLCLFACEGTTDNAVIDYGDSAIFSKSEIKSAISAVLEDFKEYKDCDLVKLRYNDAMYLDHLEMYMTYGRGSVNGIGKENVIILLGEFNVGKNADPYFAGESVTNWKWILTRKSAVDDWIIDDAGWAW